MRSLVAILRGDHRQLLVIAALAFTSVTCAALLTMRAAYSHTWGHFGLAWNLFLAWIPLVSSLVAYNLDKGRPSHRQAWPVIVVCACLWLLFFPNAPYILTDLIHLHEQDGVPLWYDLILIINFAWTGTFLGLVSLVLMQALVRNVVGGRVSWLFVFAVLALSGFGIYLGRFPRWNSWDLLFNPAGLMAEIWGQVRHPLGNPRAVVFSGLFSLLLTSIYVTAVTFAQFVPRPERVLGMPFAEPPDATK